MSIPCLVCQGQSAPFLAKRFEQFGLGDVQYDRCVDCGFVFSRTHHAMTESEWESLNNQWVSQYQGTDHNPEDPRWMERLRAQEDIVAHAARHGLLPAGRWLDYGAGDGKLAAALKKNYAIHLEKYEHSSNPAKGYLRAEELVPNAFSVVLHSAVMEHLRFRSQLDGIFNLVTDAGVMILHTLVPEQVPKDPDWFYLLSVHCSFYTNDAMQRLFVQYGYQCCAYNVASRLWFWFKQPPAHVKPLIAAANASTADPRYQYIFAEKFVDYWK